MDLASMTDKQPQCHLKHCKGNSTPGGNTRKLSLDKRIKMETKEREELQKERERKNRKKSKKKMRKKKKEKRKFK